MKTPPLNEKVPRLLTKGLAKLPKPWTSHHGLTNSISQLPRSPPLSTLGLE